MELEQGEQHATGQAFPLGQGASLTFVAWQPYPDHAENASELPTVGALFDHRDARAPGQSCLTAVVFDVAGAADLFPGKERVPVEAWRPLTLGAPLRCDECGAAGTIRDGRWEPESADR